MEEGDAGHAGGDGDRRSAAQEEPIYTKEWKEELSILLKLSGPVCVSNAFNQATLLVNQVVGGHLGLQEMAAVSLGSMWFNMLWCFVMGVATALDTLASQAFGASDISMVRIWSGTASLVLVALCAPLAGGLWMAGAAAERFFHQPDDVAALVALYCRLLIPGAGPLALVLVLNKFLQAQNIMKPSAASGMLGFSTNLVVNLVLLRRGGLGVMGPALATSSGNTLQAFFLSGCVAHHFITRRRAGQGYSSLQQGSYAPIDVEMSDRSGRFAMRESPAGERPFEQKSLGENPEGMLVLLPTLPFLVSSAGQAKQQNRSARRPPAANESGSAGSQGDLVEPEKDVPEKNVLGPAGSQGDLFNGAASIKMEEDGGGGHHNLGGPLLNGQPDSERIIGVVNGNWQAHGELGSVGGGGGMYEPAGAAAAAGFFKEVLSWRHLSQFLRLGIPGGFMFFLELAGFELTTAMAGALDTVSLDAHTAMISVCAFTFVALPFGVATAATIRVGNNLGAGRASAARRTSHIALLLGGGFMATGALPMFLLRHRIGSIFVDSEAVRDAVARIAPLAAIFQVFDGIGGCSLGVLRGMGRQATAAAINMVGFWVVMVFLAYMFAFLAHWGLVGIWWGILCGIGMTAVIGTGMILATDWEHHARRAVLMQGRGESAQGMPRPGRGGDVYDGVYCANGSQHGGLDGQDLDDHRNGRGGDARAVKGIYVRIDSSASDGGRDVTMGSV